MLGEIALWSFVVLLLTGVFLTFWFKPSMGEVVYDGSFDQLRGIHMSEAYASTLDISFDVRGGLLLRQVHHWAAMVFIAGLPAAAARHARGLHRLLAARRPALRHRRPGLRRVHEGLPRDRQLHVVLRLRWGVPG
jgi:hypothetical protein